MKIRRALFGGAVALLAAAVISVTIHGQAPAAGAAGFITGVVQGAKGPEAGVWVIAETKDLPTNFIKIVVTDDQGRFMLPELPSASYSVFVRGYGIADSERQVMKPATAPVTLRVNPAKTPQEAAKVYPGNYWLSLLEPPATSEFPGTGPQGNGLGPNMQSQNHWINSLKSDCNFCHQLGNQLTRSVDHVLKAKPELKTHAEAWEWRLGTGVRGTSMYGVLNNQGQTRSLKVYADWTERVAKGEVPPAPPRPTGIERNLVLTLWDVGDDHSFMHDLASTDKNRPTVNPNGPVYAVSAGHGSLVVLNQQTNSTEELEIPTRAPRAQVPSRFPAPNRPSLWWGNEHLWANPPYNPADPHNPMLDSKGRVWMTSKIRPNADPAWCNDPANKFAAWFPLRNSGRQASFYDPKTRQFVLIDTCYATHHLQFDNDANETVYFNELSGPIVGWIDSKVYDETKDEQKAVGWCGQVVDTNGDGRITAPPWNQITGRGESLLYTGDTTGGGGAGGRGGAGGASGAGGGPDPKLDTLVSFSLYGVIPSPVDDSVWGVAERFPGISCASIAARTRHSRAWPRSTRSRSPASIRAASTSIPTALSGPRLPPAATSPASIGASARPITGPRKVDGSECPEGWTLYQTNGPKLKGTNIPADFHYYNWVDQHNVLGLGANKPIATGSNSDSLLVLDPQTRQWVTLRVPYPLGFYSRGLDGRIDDPNGGWKGRALYANYGTHFVWHIEGGKGTKGKVVKFQLRPDPLAR